MTVPAYAGGLEHFSVADAVALIARSRTKAAVRRGNESWLSVMRLHLAQPEGQLDGGDGPAGLAYIRRSGNELRIGALTRRADLLGSALIGEHLAVVREAAKAAFGAGNPPGTVGAALCRGGACGELAAAFAAAKASFAIRGRRGIRLVSARSFRVLPAGSAVAAGELLSEIRLPIRPGGGGAYESAARAASACPVERACTAKGVAAMLSLDRHTVTGVALEIAPAMASAARAAEQFLSGMDASPASLMQAGEIIAAHCDHRDRAWQPRGDMQCRVMELVVRALDRARLRALGRDPLT